MGSATTSSSRVAPSGLQLAACLALALAACDASESGRHALELPDVTPTSACEVAADCEARALVLGYALACVTVSCESSTCQLAPLEDGLACDDGDPCTAADACRDGRCLSSTLACDDGLACTDDRCDALTGACSAVPSAACDCETDADCADAGDLCHPVFLCGPEYTCRPDPASAVVCPADGDGPCAHAVCAPETGACVPAPRGEGEPCTPSDPCFDDGVCAAGACLGVTSACDDGDPCTADVCLAGGACEHPPLPGASCDDGDPCTSADSCGAAGICAGAPVSCDDLNPCTTDACDPPTGACLHGAAEGACDDANPCTVTDTCVAGSCAGSPYPCGDANPCTTDFCVAEAGAPSCTHAPAPNPCDDGDPCTTPDACVDGACLGGPSTCECQTDADCATQQAADLCVLTWSCHAETKTCAPTAVVTCPPNETPCTVDACEPATGACVTTAKSDGTSCDDGDPCTLTDHCVGGTCLPEAEPPCDDGDACTADRCSGGQCLHDPLGGSMVFFDEDFGGGLPAGWTVASTNGAVTWKAAAADLPPAAGPALVASGPAGTYDHGATLTTVSLPPALVYGSDLKLAFRLRADFAESTGPGAICFPTKDFFAVRVVSSGLTDQVACHSNPTAGWQDVAVDLSGYAGRTVSVQLVFNANASQNAAGGVAVDDLSLVGTFTCQGEAPCTAGVCVAGVCDAAPVVCDDEDPCTGDVCDPATGACVFTPLAACTCQVDADCPGAGPCAEAACDGGTCQLVPLSGPCDDGDPCTSGDTCAAGGCAGAPADCDDGLPCTQDACTPSGGCQHTPKPGGCDDGDPCTVDDTCLGGVCQGQLLQCDLPGPCADGYCFEGACVFQLVHHGQPELAEPFDDMLPGPPPPGWTAGATHPAWQWAVMPGSDGSPPNALWALGPTEGAAPGVVLTAESPDFVVPLGGGTLSYVLEAELPTPGCGQDLVRVRVGGVVVDTVCGTTGGPSERSVDLAPFANQLVRVALEVDVKAHAAGAVTVGVDDLLVAGGYPCDDEDACTTDDVCVLGTCEGVPTPGCP